MTTEITLDQIKEAAKKFLAIADELNERVSAYVLDCSDDPKDKEAYDTVEAAEREFNKLISIYEGYPYFAPCLNYQLAEEWLQ